MLVKLFDRERVPFDAFYARVKSLNQNEEFCNYNQAYLDFELDHGSQNDRIEAHALILSAVGLKNDEIQERSGEELIMDTDPEVKLMKPQFFAKGFPVESGHWAPLMFLVPHLRSQISNFGVSMLNIASTVHSLLVSSCYSSQEQLSESAKAQVKEKNSKFSEVLERGDSPSSSSNKSPSPDRATKFNYQFDQQNHKGLVMMTMATISPKNHFKKIQAGARDRLLDQNSCSWVHAFHNVKKYKLFSLKQASSVSIGPEFVKQKSQGEILRLRTWIQKLEGLLQK